MTTEEDLKKGCGIEWDIMDRNENFHCKFICGKGRTDGFRAGYWKVEDDLCGRCKDKLESFQAGQLASQEKIKALNIQLEEHRRVLSNIKLNEKGEWADLSYYQCLEKENKEIKLASIKDEIEFLESWLDTDISNLEVYEMNKNRLEELTQKLKDEKVEE